MSVAPNMSMATININQRNKVNHVKNHNLIKRKFLKKLFEIEVSLENTSNVSQPTAKINFYIDRERFHEFTCKLTILLVYIMLEL